jgi:hypothetical protein
VSLTQLVGTSHLICRIRDSNSKHSTYSLKGGILATRLLNKKKVDKWKRENTFTKLRFLRFDQTLITMLTPDGQLFQVSFGVIGLSLGVSLLSWVLFSFPPSSLIYNYGFLPYIFPFYLFQICSYGFGAYFNILPGSEWSAIMLTYGFPLAIIGMALKVRNFILMWIKL